MKLQRLLKIISELVESFMGDKFTGKVVFEVNLSEGAIADIHITNKYRKSL